MRELRIDGTLILAVDHGYGNIKTANTIFSNGFVERDTEPVMSTDYLYYGGKYYVLDQGHKNYTHSSPAGFSSGWHQSSSAQKAADDPA